MRQVIYIWNYLEWGGAQIYLLGLMREVRKHAEILVMLPKGSDEQLLKFIDNLGVNYQFLEDRIDITQPSTILGKLNRQFKKIKSEFGISKSLRNVDLTNSVLHVELAPWQSLISLILLCRKTEVFVTMHNSLPEVPKWRYLQWRVKFGLISRFESFHIFPSNEDAKRSIQPLVSEAFYQRTKVTYTNVNPDEVEEALHAEASFLDLKLKFDLPLDKTLVFCVGQFIDRKGRWTFLEAAKSVCSENSDVAFVWIANSKPSNSDLKRTELYGLRSNFTFITSDQVGSEHIDLFKLLRNAEIFVLASFQEGLPISLLEAMALGIPSISTNVNAIPEAVKHMETGWLVDAGNDKQLAEAIITLKNDRELRDSLGKNGREFVLENFNEKIVAQIAWNEYLKAFE